MLRLCQKTLSHSHPLRPARWTRALLVMLCALLLTGCNKEKEKWGWDEIETYFDEPLASLSTEGDSVHWVGGEYGDLWRMTAEGRQHYKLGSERIYHVVRHGSDYWIGTATVDWRNIISTGRRSHSCAIIPSTSKVFTTRSTTSSGRVTTSMPPPAKVSSP